MDVIADDRNQAKGAVWPIPVSSTREITAVGPTAGSERGKVRATYGQDLTGRRCDPSFTAHRDTAQWTCSTL